MEKKRILIIDDDVNAVGLLRLKLERTGGYEVKEEADGRRALAAVREFRPDLILLDVQMPNIDGGEVAFLIQADKELKHTPILFMTSIVSEQESSEEGLLSGGHRFVSKAVSFPQIVQRIEAVLASRSPRARDSVDKVRPLSGRDRS